MKKSIIIICLSITYGHLRAQDLAWVIAPAPTYETVTPFSEGYSVVSKGDKYYFLDKQLHLSSDCYRYAYPVSQGLALVRERYTGHSLNDYLWRYRQDENKYVGGEYDDGQSFQHGFAAVKHDGKWGFINLVGYESISCKYAGVQLFHSNWTSAVRLDKTFIINKLGSEVNVPYHFVFPYSEDLAAVETQKGDFGYMDTLGNLAIPIQSGRKYGGSFSEGLAVVSDTLPNLSYIDRMGKVLLWYGNATQKGGHYGTDLTEMLIQEVHTFSEGRAAVRQNGKWGFINTNGTVVVPFDYDEVTRFSEGVAAVKAQGVWQYINKAGYTVKQGEDKNPFLEAKPCTEQLAWVRTLKGWGLLAMGEKLEIVVHTPFKNSSTPRKIQMKAHISSHRPLKNATWTLNGQLIENEKFAMNAFEADISANVSFQQGKNILQVAADNGLNKKINECIIYCNPESNQPVQYQALLVANNLYQNEPWETLENPQESLGSPIADADSLAQVLYEKYQFRHIFVARNATLSQMQSLLQDLSQQKDSMIRTLFFYAGHGDFDSTERQAFMVPVDAKGRDHKTHLSASSFIRKVQLISLQHVATIIDACYGGSFILDVPKESMRGGEVRNKNKPQNLKKNTQMRQKQPPKETIVFQSSPESEELLKSRQCISSGQRVEVPNASVFIISLLQVLNENEEEKLRIGMLFEKVKKPITSQGLVPQYGILPNAGSDGGDFIFRKQPMEPKRVEISGK